MERLALIAANDVPLSPSKGVAAFGEQFIGVSPDEVFHYATYRERGCYSAQLVKLGRKTSWVSELSVG
jgi:hypothetical protein